MTHRGAHKMALSQSIVWAPQATQCWKEIMNFLNNVAHGCTMSRFGASYSCINLHNIRANIINVMKPGNPAGLNWLGLQWILTLQQNKLLFSTG